MSSLAAARADNFFYYPPEWDPKKGGLKNKFHGLERKSKKNRSGYFNHKVRN
ncbi:hypothetical protein HanPI659440_Chr17g0678721 [Helianthus annuus]|nr:hypothetical protein HanPI659440_Chr17g0678721 [Helianthus annuus]